MKKLCFVLVLLAVALVYACPPGGQGIQGIQGPRGFRGFNGTQGLQGLRGDVGPGGPIGPAGQQGPRGLQGFNGTRGPKGFNGTRGLQGLQGTQGLQGIQGQQGLRGLQGFNGSTGARGLQGAQGPRGFNGTNGLPGPSVPSADNTGSLGLQAKRWAEVYGVVGSFNNSVNAGSLVVNGASSVHGPATFANTVSFSGLPTMNNGAHIFGVGQISTLTVTGNSFLNGNVNVGGTTTLGPTTVVGTVTATALSVGSAAIQIGVSSGIIQAPNLALTGTLSSDNGAIISDGTGDLTVGSLLIGPALLQLQTVTVTVTPAQIYAATTSNSITLIPTALGKYAKIMSVTVTGSSVPFTGGTSPVFVLNTFVSGGVTQLGGGVTLTAADIFTSSVQYVMTSGLTGILTTPVLVSNAYQSTYSLVMVSGPTYTGGGSNIVINVLFYYSA